MTETAPSSSQGLETARRFRRLYLVALSLIAALAIGGQLLVQHSLNNQRGDGSIVNMSGYQRMLNQRITLKLMLHEPGAPDASAQRAAIAALRDRWLSAHRELAAGLDRIAFGEPARQTFAGLLRETEQPLQRIAALVAQFEKTGRLTATERTALMADQELFLPLMDAVVLAVEHSVNARVTFLQRVEFSLLFITLLVLTLDACLIFRPAVSRLQSSLDQLERRNRQATRRLESLRHLAGGIAHSFNNLLTGIMGHADLERWDAIRHRRSTEYIDAQIKGCKRAAEIITHLVTYSGHGQYDFEPTALGAWLDALTRSFGSGDPAVQARLETEEEVMAEIDRVALKQALEGILTNAVEAMDGRPGLVTVTLSTVMLTEPRLMSGPYRTELMVGLYARIRVTDQGKGIAPENIERIFDPYYTRKEFGRGLGLAAVLGIVHGHGGGIEVESSPGHGSVVSLFVPATGNETDSSPTKTKTPAQATTR